MRWCRTLIVLLIVGLLISLVTAWACLRWIPSAPWQHIRLKENDPLALRIAQYGQFDRFSVLTGGGCGWDVQFILGADSKSHLSRGNKQAHNSVRLVHSGWPWRCLSGEEWTLKGTVSHHGAIAPSTGPLAGGEGLYPLRPIWVGLIADMVLFSGTIGAAWFGVVLIRHHRRQRQGWCKHCGYDLRGQPAGAGSHQCPECGRPGA